LTIASVWPRRHRPRIIYHHSVHPNLEGSLSPDNFRRQIEWLRSNGYEFLNFSDLVRRALSGEIPNKAVSITFDDGYLDNYNHALPILIEEGVTATFFVASGLMQRRDGGVRIGEKLYPNRQMMSDIHLRELIASGMEVGSHTRTHIHVRNTMQRSVDVAWDELVGSRTELEEMTNSKITSFAYPNGQKGVFNASTRDLLRRAGYKYGATTIWGYVKTNSNPLEVPRIGINTDDSLNVFCAKMLGKYDFITWIHKLRDGSRKWQ